MGLLVPSIPATQTAVVTTADGVQEAASGRAVPQCGPTSVLVRVCAVALNPTDHKTPARVKQAGLTSGCDFAGEVVAVGDRANDEPSQAARPRHWTVGDRVLGVVYGSNPGQPDWGAFAEYVEADPVMLCHAPDGWDWETAASIGGSVHGSVALCMFGQENLGLSMDKLILNVSDAEARNTTPTPQYPPAVKDGQFTNEDLRKVVLVYGGSTACGTMALQILRLAGYLPVTTCSPRNNSLVESYGAIASFDYNSETCAADIRKFTKSSLAYTLDCIATAQSAVLCYQAIGRAGGRYVALEKYPGSVAASRKAVKPNWVMGPVMFGRDLQLAEGYSQPADPKARQFAREWYAVAEALALGNQFKSHPIRSLDSGNGAGDWTGAVLGGLSDLREGKVSAQKLVVKITS